MLYCTVWLYARLSGVHVEKYFDMNRKHCKEALDQYKKFLDRMDGVAKVFKVAEVKGAP